VCLRAQAPHSRAACNLVVLSLSRGNSDPLLLSGVQGVGGSAALYKNAWDCAMTMARTEGAKSLYRGLTATCIRGVPNTGIQFAVYEGLKTLLLIA